MDTALETRIRAEIEAEISRDAPPPDFPKLPDLPIARYSDPEFYELEAEHLFRSTWLYACHSSELPKPGSFKVFDATGAPIVVIRGANGEVRAFYNSCRHRGAPVVRDECGTARRLTCQFHSWSYDTTGQLVAVPDNRDFVGLCKEDRGLVEVRCEAWHGWIFINEDPSASSLHQFLGPLTDEMAELAGCDLRIIDAKSHAIPCNWKVTIEAFLEVYHIKTVHPGTVGQLLDHRGCSIGLLAEGHSRMVVPYRDPSAVASTEVPGPYADIPSVGELIRTTSTAYSIFPNIIVPAGTPGFPFLVAWPIDERTTRLDVIWFGPDYGDDERPAFWDFVVGVFDGLMDEDKQNMAPIQRTMESRGARSIPLNYQERRLFHFNAHVDRVIGRDLVPDELAVPPLLDHLIET